MLMMHLVYVSAMLATLLQLAMDQLVVCRPTTYACRPLKSHLLTFEALKLHARASKVPKNEALEAFMSTRLMYTCLGPDANPGQSSRIGARSQQIRLNLFLSAMQQTLFRCEQSRYTALARSICILAAMLRLSEGNKLTGDVMLKTPMLSCSHDLQIETGAIPHSGHMCKVALSRVSLNKGQVKQISRICDQGEITCAVLAQQGWRRLLCESQLCSDSREDATGQAGRQACAVSIHAAYLVCKQHHIVVHMEWQYVQMG